MQSKKTILRLNQKGVLHIMLLLGIVSIVTIIALANLAPFKDIFLASLYPKTRNQ